MVKGIKSKLYIWDEAQLFRSEMSNVVSVVTKDAILRDLFDPTKNVGDIISIYRDVCSEQMIHTIGTEYGIDWELRDRLQGALMDQERLNALIVEMECTFLDAVKDEDADRIVDRPMRHRRYYRRYRREC